MTTAERKVKVTLPSKQTIARVKLILALTKYFEYKQNEFNPGTDAMIISAHICNIDRSFAMCGWYYKSPYNTIDRCIPGGKRHSIRHVSENNEVTIIIEDNSKDGLYAQVLEHLTAPLNTLL